MKLTDWLLLWASGLLLIAMCATIARADEMTRTMTFGKWVSVRKQCQVRIAGPIKLDQVKNGPVDITMSGNADQLKCVDALLGKKGKETPK